MMTTSDASVRRANWLERQQSASGLICGALVNAPFSVFQTIKFGWCIEFGRCVSVSCNSESWEWTLVELERSHTHRDLGYTTFVTGF